MTSHAPSVPAPDSAAARAYARLAALDGAWVAGDFPVTFAKVGRGAAVTQDSGFFVVWHLDGDHLAAALFPDDGYHATLRSTRISADGATIELATEHVGNVKPTSPVARAVTVILDDGTVTERWMFRTPAGHDEPFELVLRRPPTSRDHGDR